MDNKSQTMRQYLYILILSCLPLVGVAQQRFSAEIVPYETRIDSDAATRTKAEYYISFEPDSATDTYLRMNLSRPDKWSDRVIVLHLENVLISYTLVINGVEVLNNSDDITPTDIDVTKYLREGGNTIDIVANKSNNISTLNPTERPMFEGSYLCAYPYTHIHDAQIALAPTATPGDARLNISVVLRNAFTQGESVDVGYDIYDPQGNLLDFSVNNFEVEAGASETINFSTMIYNTSSNEWSPKSPKLYRVTLYTRRNGVITECVPRRVALVDARYEELSLNVAPYNAAESRELTRSNIERLKSQGVNTLALSYPQPVWFYDLALEQGVWIVEQPNINSEHEPTNKKVGGTPANNPALVNEYLRRGASSYYRSRDYDNIIAYSLAGESSGNGYNLYKLYEWFKGVESRRPIIYIGGAGEWNSDK